MSLLSLWEGFFCHLQYLTKGVYIVHFGCSLPPSLSLIFPLANKVTAGGMNWGSEDPPAVFF